MRFKSSYKPTKVLEGEFVLMPNSSLLIGFGGGKLTHTQLAKIANNLFCDIVYFGIKNGDVFIHYSNMVMEGKTSTSTNKKYLISRPQGSLVGKSSK